MIKKTVIFSVFSNCVNYRVENQTTEAFVVICSAKIILPHYWAMVISEKFPSDVMATTVVAILVLMFYLMQLADKHIMYKYGKKSCGCMNIITEELSPMANTEEWLKLLWKIIQGWSYSVAEKNNFSRENIVLNSVCYWWKGIVL